MDKLYFVIALLAFTGALFLGGNLKAQRIPLRGVVIQDNSVRKGSATTLDFASDFTVTCNSGGQECDVDADSDIYMVGEITPDTADEMPLTNVWPISQDTIQITADPDSINDLVRKSHSDNAQRYWLWASTSHGTTLSDGDHLFFNMNGKWSSNNEAEIVLAVAMTCDHLWVDTIGTNGQALEQTTVWLLKNGVRTDLTCNFHSDTDPGCDDAGSASFALGDTYSFEQTCDGTNCPINTCCGDNLTMIAECLLD